MGNFLDITLQGFGVRMLKYYCRVPTPGFRVLIGKITIGTPLWLGATDIGFDFMSRPRSFQNQRAIIVHDAPKSRIQQTLRFNW